MSTSDWQQFLESQGAEVLPATSDASSSRYFSAKYARAASTVSNQVFDLADIGCLWLEGVDAAKFLQGQVTCDVNEVTGSQLRRGAICNLQGRMICSFRLFKSAENQFGLLMHRGLLDSVAQWFSKYIVFSKAKARIDSSFVAVGYSGQVPAGLLQSWPTDIQAAVPYEGGAILRVDDDRYLAWLPVEAAQSFWQSVIETAEPADMRDWHLHDIRASYAEVFPATAGEFIPQMLGIEQHGGVSFKKGCYIGQEVVARMQYLGKLKRHLQHAELKTKQHPKAGDPLYSPGSNQSIGNLVNVTPSGPETFELLAVITDTARQADDVYITGDCREKLHFISPPYAITK